MLIQNPAPAKPKQKLPPNLIPSLRLVCIADDYTGATDLANNLVRSGMRVMQTFGIPHEALPANTDVDAVVVALKSRSLPPDRAVAESLAALTWLQTLSQAPTALQVYFKYCSTFDSVYTPAVQGNIGAVCEALMSALDTGFTVATPAFPDNGRTVFQGHLFVGEVLLNESGMQHHPLTPMKDSNLLRVLQAQTSQRVGLIDYKVVAVNHAAIAARMAELTAKGIGIAIIDAVSNEDLMRLGRALESLPLVTGGSGVAIGLPQNFGIKPSTQASRLPPAQGLQAVVSGSCSLASNRQVAHYLATGKPAWALDPRKHFEPSAAGKDWVSSCLDWARTQYAAGATSVLVYATANAQTVKSVQDAWGAATAGEWVERTLALISRGLVEMGVRQLVVAGGETSGACVQALGIQHLQVGPQIDPGVPWCYAQQGELGLHIALKSGNFGGDAFFTQAFEMALDALDDLATR